MHYKKWEPVYHEILEDMGFSEKDDILSANYISEYFKSNPENIAKIEDLEKIIFNNSIVICGNSPDLIYDLSYFLSTVSNFDIRSYKFIAADGATSALINIGIIPDAIVTDLDGKHLDDITNEINASNKSVVLIHAHGDNLNLLKKYLPQFKNVIPTCQSRPPSGVFNFGGFTDGDRCLFVSDFFKAKNCILVGFDFKDKHVSDLKHKKLKWAKKLIKTLKKEGLPVTYVSIRKLKRSKQKQNEKQKYEKTQKKI